MERGRATRRRIRAVIADDNESVRGGLRTVLETDRRIEVVGEAGDGAGAIVVSASLRPDIVLLDVRMPVLDGIRAIPGIKEACPDTRILMVTMHSDARTREEALAAGADGVLLKDESARAILAAVRAGTRRPAI
jgi:two-component system NarL family response regulator